MRRSAFWLMRAVDGARKLRYASVAIEAPESMAGVDILTVPYKAIRQH